MFAQVASILFPVIALVVVGYLLTKWFQPDFSPINRMNLVAFTPALVFSSLVSMALDTQQLPLLGASVVAVIIPGILIRNKPADLDQVPVIGDSLDDINAARAAGARPILVKTGHGFGTVSHPELDASVPVYEDLFQAADALLNIQNT